MKRTLFTSLVFAAGLTLSQGALTILSDPTSATASSQFDAAHNVTNLYDGDLTLATPNFGNNYAGAGAGPHTITYDMGSAVEVGGFMFANRTGSGVADQTIQIEFWFGPTASGAPARTIDTTPSNNRNLAEYDFGSNVSTRFVTMRFTGGTFNIGGAELMLATTTSAVPEPSSAALLGLGGLALVLRRRK